MHLGALSRQCGQCSKCHQQVAGNFTPSRPHRHRWRCQTLPLQCPAPFAGRVAEGTRLVGLKAPWLAKTVRRPVMSDSRPACGRTRAHRCYTRCMAAGGNGADDRKDLEPDEPVLGSGACLTRQPGLSHGPSRHLCIYGGAGCICLGVPVATAAAGALPVRPAFVLLLAARKRARVRPSWPFRH